MLDLLLHIDKYIGVIVEQYGVLTYAILFLILFAETGIVVTPFLPGDSLLFALGALSAQGIFEPFFLATFLIAAAILGDSANYWIGAHSGDRLISNSRLIKDEHIAKTNHFYDKYGGKAIVIARFIPIVRTLAPFVAGVARMEYGKFARYNVFGALLWVPSFIALGYFFGNLPAIQKNFSLVVIGIIIVSLIPAGIEALRAYRQRVVEEN